MKPEHQRQSLTQWWSKFDVTGKFVLTAGVLLGTLVLVALVGILAQITVQRQTSAAFGALQNVLQQTPADGSLLADAVVQQQRQLSRTSRVALAATAATVLISLVVAVWMASTLNKSIVQKILGVAETAAKLQETSPLTQLGNGAGDEIDQITQTLEQLRRNLKQKDRTDKLLDAVIPIGVALTAERNFDRLLEKILLEAKDFCNADAGTLYLSTENATLKFVLVRNESLNIQMGGTSGHAIDFPPIALHNSDGQPNYSNVAAYVALTGEAINIPNAYQADGFNFSGTKSFDQRTGYCSTSFLTIPLKNAHQKVLGVLQLINAQDSAGRIIPFDSSLEVLVTSLSSLATVALESYIREQNLRQEIHQLRIEIDEVKRKQHVSEIIETDFFKDLQKKAQDMRHRDQGRGNREED